MSYRIWDIVGDQSYVQEFSSNASIIRYSNLPRFGHNNEFSSVFSSNREELDDYLFGLVFIAAFLLAFFTIWYLQIGLCKCLGPKKVGVFSGHPYETDSKSSKCGRFIYAFSAVFVLALSILFVTEGLNSLQISANTIDAVNQDVIAIKDELAGIATHMKEIGTDATPIRDELRDFLQKDICPLQPMSSREVEVRSIGEATLSSINELADFLGENLSMLEEQLDIVEKATVDIDSVMTKTNFTGAPSAIIVTLTFLTAAFLGSALLLGWFEVYAESYYCFITWFILPMFVLLLITAIAGSGIAVIFAQANSDWCIGSSNATPEKMITTILEKRGFERGELYYDIVNFYSSQCRETDPWEFLQNYYTNLDKSEIDLNAFVDIIEFNTAAQLTQECGTEYSMVLDLMNNLLTHIRILISSSERSMRLLNCENIVPLYTTAVYDASCYDSPKGAEFVFLSLLGIAFFGSLILMFRGSHYPISYYYNKEDGRSVYSTSVEEGIAENDSKDIIEDYSLNQDDSDSFVESYASEESTDSDSFVES